MNNPLPPPPPGFKLDPPKRNRRSGGSSAPAAPPLSERLPPAPLPRVRVGNLPPSANARPIDGDTMRLGDAVLRTWGIDAPELAQQGWKRNGGAVPVGRQSFNRLSDMVAGQTVTPGPSQGLSYGRTVAPVTIGNADLAQQLLREGQAYAAPSFIANDPERRFDYLQAERLARLNRLGVHDYLVQPPAEHRANPGFIPARETVAMFFDTPTPIAGMSVDAERRYLELLDTAQTPGEIIEFVESQGGFTLNPDEVADFLRARNTARTRGGDLNVSGGVTYRRGPQPLTDLGDGAFGAGARAYTQGFTAGGLDELGAVADMLGGTQGRENIWNSDRRWADIWANNQAQNSSILGFDDFAHPNLTTGANVAGALTSGFMIPYGQGARTVPQLARVGAAYGGLAGALTPDGGLPERGTGAVIGAGLGAIANPLLAKGFEAAAPLAVRGWRYATGRGLPRGAGVVGDAAGGFGEDQALDAAQGAAQGARGVDRFDIPPGSPMTLGGVPEPVATGYPGPLNGRERNWIDIGTIPPPPPGFTLTHPAANDLGEVASNLQELTAMARRARPDTMGMDADPPPSISGEVPRQRDYIDVSGGAVRPRRLGDPLPDEERAALLGNLQPRDVLPIPANEVGSVDEAAGIDAGRIVPATAPNERGALTSTTLRNWRGEPVPKVGPTDLIGWVRLRGGLRDDGGELSHMGFTNAARRGLDHVGQEARFGPLVNNTDGDNLDDAALAAWEAGYFPELSERPSINEFLQALDDTYRGGANRRFLPEDQPQLDAYYGRQAERYDLEQEQLAAGGPVYVDRSQPGDENAPFAPPEAYEEWPAEAMQRAGNIRLDKLDTPQDIDRALVQMHRQVGFDAATRGRVTQAETERLASEMGMTADDLLSRRHGQALNAEEALAARQILAASANHLVNLARRLRKVDNPGDEEAAAFQRALLRHAAIQEQVAGATAEAGRALSQFRMMADSRALSREVLSTIVDHGGGPRRVKEAADLILEAVEDGPGRFNTVTRKAAKPRFADKLAELYINNLLSGPQTHVVNAVSNAMTAISQLPEHLVASGIGGARRLVARREVDRVLGGEVGARLFSMVQGAREGFQYFARALKTGETSDTFSKIAGHDLRAISGIKGEVIRIPGRLLNSADEFFKGISRRAEINALAYRQAHKEGLTGDALRRRVAELSANPPEDIEHRALDFARYMTFQRPLSGMGQNVQRLVRDYPLLRPVITFVRTPVNLLKFSLERSPAAPILKEWRADFKAGGARRDLALARATLGSGVVALAYMAALDGRITGGAPLDQAKNRFMRADGWQPYSVRIGDQWVSYSRLDPFAMQFGVVADLATKAEGMSDKQLDDYSMLLVASVMSQLADKTWLSGVSDFVNALSDPQRYGPAYLRRLGASAMLPNALPQVARAVDPVQRERDSFGAELQSRIPGASDGLLPSRDIWGRPITSEGGVGPDFLSPFRVSTARNDPVNAAMLDIGARFGPPSKQNTREGQRQDYTPEQYDRLQELAGGAAYSGIAELVSSSAWRGMDNRARLKAARRVFERARADARASVLGTGGDDAPPPPAGFSPAGGSAPLPPPPPPGFSVEGEAGGVNIYRELQDKIPGVRFSSGFRDYDYNQTLQDRGYNAADNTTHMDGDTLDMLPPVGRSLGWLRAQVKRNYPRAELLVHDGHLHARFPGYYGAPVLGGAVSAGVRNPYAGMPPPPPGYTLEAR